MKKIKLSLVILLLAIILFGCNNTSSTYQELTLQELIEWSLNALDNGWFWLDRETTRHDDGTTEIVYIPGPATQRRINMINYILREQEPQILFSGRDIVFYDIVESPIELWRFLEDRYPNLKNEIEYAINTFEWGWRNGYIDHDDVDGDWRW